MSERLRIALAAIASLTAVVVFMVVQVAGSDDPPSRQAATFMTTEPPASTASTVTPEQEAQRAEASDWLAASREAFTLLADNLTAMLGDLAAWREGEVTDSVIEEHIERFRLSQDITLERVVDLPAIDLVPAAPILELSAARIYDTVLVAFSAMLRGEGDLRAELDQSGMRLHNLAGAVFDQGHQPVREFLHQPGEIANPPDPVPDWVELSLEPGPLLDASPSGGGLVAETDVQPRDEWLEEVEAAGAPTSADVIAALDRADGAALQDLARRFRTAAAELRSVELPRDAPTDGYLVQLVLLLHAEAADLAQLSVRFSDIGIHAEQIVDLVETTDLIQSVAFGSGEP